MRIISLIGLLLLVSACTAPGFKSLQQDRTYWRMKASVADNRYELQPIESTVQDEPKTSMK